MHYKVKLPVGFVLLSSIKQRPSTIPQHKLNLFSFLLLLYLLFPLSILRQMTQSSINLKFASS